ncbi:MAG: pantothenate kinase [Methanosarcinales archaeon]|nr:pantothenate kinase [Methanosarcinales archaeon]
MQRDEKPVSPQFMHTAYIRYKKIMSIHNPGSASAFAPAHITGFFVICEHENPALMGSLGCGVTLRSGVVTSAIASGHDNMPCGIPVVRSVISRLAPLPCSVMSRSDIPIGAGFGASGAYALGTALALNHALQLNLTAGQLTRVAHIAEVKNMTGLGDVVAQSLGGVVIRRTAGAAARLNRIYTGERDVFWVVFDKISTKELLEDESTANQVNPVGRDSLRELLKKPTFENFMHQSKRFAVETGLMSDAVSDAVQAVEAAGGMASQAMLGDVVFAVDLPDRRDADDASSATGTIESVLSEFGSVGRSGIDFGGARLI